MKKTKCLGEKKKEDENCFDFVEKKIYFSHLLECFSLLLLGMNSTFWWWFQQCFVLEQSFDAGLSHCFDVLIQIDIVTIFLNENHRETAAQKNTFFTCLEKGAKKAKYFSLPLFSPGTNIFLLAINHWEKKSLRRDTHKHKQINLHFLPDQWSFFREVRREKRERER